VTRKDTVDIIAHGLSTGVVLAAARRKSSVPPIRLRWALLFGVLPDLVAFAIPACLRIWWYLSGASPSLLPTPNGPHFEWVWTVYNAGHSLLAFAVVFGGLWLVAGRPVLEALAWALHILLDIFSHRGMFAIQFLWPVASLHFDGIPWETPWLLAATYGSLAAAWLVLVRRHVARPRGQDPVPDGAVSPK
jgi:hypothetical protein